MHVTQKLIIFLKENAPEEKVELRRPVSGRNRHVRVPRREARVPFSDDFTYCFLSANITLYNQEGLQKKDVRMVKLTFLSI